MLIDDSKDRYRPIARSKIINLAERYTYQYLHLAGPRAQIGISFDKMFNEFIYPDFEVTITDSIPLGNDESGNAILGQFDAIANEVYFDPRLRSDPRECFTRWHEIGHVILHGDWIRRVIKRHSTTDLSLSPGTESVLEVEANTFASYMAAPQWLVESAFVRTFGRRPLVYNGPGEYSFALVNRPTQFHHVSNYVEMCNKMARYMKCYFGGLSQEALGHRIEQAELVISREAKTLKLNRVARNRSPLQSIQSL